jgi:GT2 family glycosyltransferase
LFIAQPAITKSVSKSTESPKIASIVLSYNNGKLLLKCIDSLLRQTYPNIQIIIVDNASSDNSIEEINKTYHGACIIIRSQRNSGTASRNLGIKYALELGCDMIFLTDGDTVMDSNLIEVLLSKITDVPKIGIAGASCYEVNRGDYAPIVHVNSLTAEIQIIGYVRNCSETMAVGAALIRSQVFTRTGLYNPSYFAYYEDADICIKAIKEGFKVVIAPEARYHHYPATSVKQIPGLRGLVSIRNRFIFIKSTQLPRVWLLFFIIHPYHVIRTVGLWLTSREFKELQTALIGYLSGIWYMLHGKESKIFKHIFENLLRFKVSFT